MLRALGKSVVEVGPSGPSSSEAFGTERRAPQTSPQPHRARLATNLIIVRGETLPHDVLYHTRFSPPRLLYRSVIEACEPEVEPPFLPWHAQLGTHELEFQSHI